MEIWIERQLEFMGAYRINLATTALVQLLASRHPVLMALQVLTHPSDCCAVKFQISQMQRFESRSLAEIEQVYSSMPCI